LALLFNAAREAPNIFGATQQVAPTYIGLEVRVWGRGKGH
jgi:hypothetical protein